MNVRPMCFAALLAVFVGAGAAVSGPARAQAPGGGECALPREPSGLIRGDRVPTGCVMVERHARDAASRPAIVSGHRVVLVPVVVRSALFLPDPPFIGVPPAPGAVTGADSLPRARSGPFGPIERRFGPPTQPFRPTNRDFAVAPAPTPARPPR